ncbi:MAG TPA: DnaJ domain-containing protein [Chloroflexota bacterium]|nr:DnaJ domain-containing protein [Chloroflexota bacterium]
MSQFPYSQYVQAQQAYGGQIGSTGQIPRFSPSLVAANSDLARAYTTLWLRPGAPLGVVKAAYRALAQQYHPDAGGDALAMRRLNEAYETLRRSLSV